MIVRLMSAFLWCHSVVDSQQLFISFPLLPSPLLLCGHSWCGPSFCSLFVCCLLGDRQTGTNKCVYRLYARLFVYLYASVFVVVHQITDSPRGGQEGGSGRVFLCEQELCVLPTVVSTLHVYTSHCNDWKYIKYRSNTIIPYLVFDLYFMYYNRLIIDNVPTLLVKAFLVNSFFIQYPFLFPQPISSI